MNRLTEWTRFGYPDSYHLPEQKKSLCKKFYEAVKDREICQDVVSTIEGWECVFSKGTPTKLLQIFQDAAFRKSTVRDNEEKLARQHSSFKYMRQVTPNKPRKPRSKMIRFVGSQRNDENAHKNNESSTNEHSSQSQLDKRARENTSRKPEPSQQNRVWGKDRMTWSQNDSARSDRNGFKSNRETAGSDNQKSSNSRSWQKNFNSRPNNTNKFRNDKFDGRNRSNYGDRNATRRRVEYDNRESDRKLISQDEFKEKIREETAKGSRNANVSSDGKIIIKRNEIPTNISDRADFNIRDWVPDKNTYARINSAAYKKVAEKFRFERADNRGNSGRFRQDKRPTDPLQTSTGNPKYSNKKNNSRLPAGLRHLVRAINPMEAEFIIPVMVNNNIVQGTLDSGSTISAINYAVYQKLKKTQKVPDIQKNLDSYISASNQRIRSKGTVKMDVTIGNQVFKEWPLVVLDMPSKCLLGADIFERLMKDGGIGFRYASKGARDPVLQIFNSDGMTKLSIPLAKTPFGSRTISVRNIVVSEKSKTIELRAKAEKSLALAEANVVEVDASSNLEDKYQLVIMEPGMGRYGGDSCQEKTLKPKKGSKSLKLKIFNDTKQPLKISKGQVIAKLYPAESCKNSRLFKRDVGIVEEFNENFKDILPDQIVMNENTVNQVSYQLDPINSRKLSTLISDVDSEEEDEVDMGIKTDRFVNSAHKSKHDGITRPFKVQHGLPERHVPELKKIIDQNTRLFNLGAGLIKCS